jgi:hypothetical protein
MLYADIRYTKCCTSLHGLQVLPAVAANEVKDTVKMARDFLKDL